MRLVTQIMFLFTAVQSFSQNTLNEDGPIHANKLNWNAVLKNSVWSYVYSTVQGNATRIIDFDAIGNWTQVGDYLAVSKNGKYFAYTTKYVNQIPDDYGNVDSLIVESTNGSWRIALNKTLPGFFSRDNKQYIFQDNQRLCFLFLDEHKTEYVDDVVSYKVINGNENEWLAYKKRDKELSLVIKNLITGREKRFSHVTDYEFDNSNNWLVCQVGSKDSDSSSCLLFYNLTNGSQRYFPNVIDRVFAASGSAVLLKTMEGSGKGKAAVFKYADDLNQEPTTIWTTQERSVEVVSYSIDGEGDQVVLCIRDTGKSARVDLAPNSIMYFKVGMEKATLKVSDNNDGVFNGMKIQGPVAFSDNGRYITFFVNPKHVVNAPDLIWPGLVVWNHKDLSLQSLQAKLVMQPVLYKAILNLETGRIFQLESESKSLYLIKGNFAVVKKNSVNTPNDRFWEEAFDFNNDSNWLVSLQNGSSRLLPTRGGKESLWFSPGGNYLVYFDARKGCHYFSYDLQTGKIKNISENIPDGRLGYVPRYLRSNDTPTYAAGLAAWMRDDVGVLVYDNNDIWHLDLSGRKPAVNITNDLGRSNGIIFSLMTSKRLLSEIPVLNPNENLLLRAFNSENKYTGFYEKLNLDVAPQELYMGPYFTHKVDWCQDPNLSNNGKEPVKAKDTNTWIVQRQSSADAPNYYETTDFKSYKKLTNSHPHSGFNWLSEEIYTFKHLDGKTGQGILYKPQNFDSTKKYPVLIVFYGGYSNNLFQFPKPDYNSTAITPGVSPIWFLNNDYLVFTPDIYVTPLEYGPEALNVIEGASKFLKLFPFVNGNRLGVCSHSWSAKLGSYIFTHSKSFSAMAISEGFLYANMINVALSGDDDGRSKLEDVERRFHFGSLWENKKSWLDQTAILNVDKSTSSLLLFCNKASSKEYQDQTLQLFTALRRLEKRVWWLSYEKGGHTLNDLNEKKDYTIRYTQYFDHYLKDAPAPRWMTHGISANMKGFDMGYELDPNGSCVREGSNKCKVCDNWNGQYKKTPEMFTKPISEWHLDESK